MARKITLFELYFDGIRFGPTDDDETDADEPAFESVDADDEPSGRSRVRPALGVLGALAVVSAAGVMAVRRFRRDAGPGELDVDEGDYEYDDYEHEHDYESVGRAEDRDEATLE